MPLALGLTPRFGSVVDKFKKKAEEARAVESQAKTPEEIAKAQALAKFKENEKSLRPYLKAAVAGITNPPFYGRDFLELVQVHSAKGGITPEAVSRDFPPNERKMVLEAFRLLNQRGLTVQAQQNDTSPATITALGEVALQEVPAS